MSNYSEINIEGLKKISYVYHIADIHIRNDMSRVDEYREVFMNFVSMLKKESKEVLDESIIVILGDILDKSNITSVVSRLFKEVLAEMSSVMPVIFIAGNHDLSNEYGLYEDGLDSIMYNIVGYNERIFYLIGSGAYKICNIIFGLSDIRDNRANSDDFNIYPSNKIISASNETKIGLYHGGINDCIMQNNNNMKCNINNKSFEGYDIVMLGDIHKHQFMNASKTIAYSGSLIQQNYGEDLNNHGYIKWDINRRTGEFIKVKNDYGFINIDLINGHNDLSIIPNNVRIKYIYDNKDKFKEFKTKLEKDLNEMGIKIISRKENYINNKIILNNVAQTGKIDISDNQKIIKELMREKIGKLLDKDNQDLLIKMYETQYNEYNKNVEIDDFLTNRICGVWKIKKIEYDNILSYDKGNFNFLFENDDVKIIGINGLNTSGKSSIINIILYAIYNDVDRFDKNKGRESNLFNKNEKRDSLRTKIEIEIGEYIIIIERNILSSGVSKVSVRIINIKCNIDKTYSDKTKCSRIIYNIFGEVEEFKKTSLIYQSSETKEYEFISLPNSKRYKLFKKILNIEYLDLFKTIKDTENKSIINDITTNKNKITLMKNQIGDENQIESMNKIKELNNIFNVLNAKLNDNNDKIRNTIKYLVEDINIDEILRKKNRLEMEISKIVIEECDDISIIEEKHKIFNDNKMKQIINISDEINNKMKSKINIPNKIDDITELKNKIEENNIMQNNLIMETDVIKGKIKKIGKITSMDKIIKCHNKHEEQKNKDIEKYYKLIDELLNKRKIINETISNELIELKNRVNEYNDIEEKYKEYNEIKNKLNGYKNKEMIEIGSKLIYGDRCKSCKHNREILPKIENMDELNELIEKYESLNYVDNKYKEYCILMNDINMMINNEKDNNINIEYNKKIYEEISQIKMKIEEIKKDKDIVYLVKCKKYNDNELYNKDLNNKINEINKLKELNEEIMGKIKHVEYYTNIKYNNDEIDNEINILNKKMNNISNLIDEEYDVNKK